MAFKLIDATDVRSGTAILVDGEPCLVRSMDKSKTGKHGASKCRIEAISIMSGNKKIVAVPGSTRFEVPMIEKNRAQILSITEGNANVMDSDSFENFEVVIPEEFKEDIKEGDQVEYWKVNGKKIIKRKM
ncbi:MAG: translation initiation factor IF-5A [archaeon]